MGRLERWPDKMVYIGKTNARKDEWIDVWTDDNWLVGECVCRSEDVCKQLVCRLDGWMDEK